MLLLIFGFLMIIYGLGLYYQFKFQWLKLLPVYILPKQLEADLTTKTKVKSMKIRLLWSIGLLAIVLSTLLPFLRMNYYYLERILIVFLIIIYIGLEYYIIETKILSKQPKQDS
ncbi:MAG: hypothetical protein IPQ18_13140 [Saprospiraceae bacterium]|nr:hypothetical protein [Saprospiraceae bacterium]